MMKKMRRKEVLLLPKYKIDENFVRKAEQNPELIDELTLVDLNKYYRVLDEMRLKKKI